MLALGAGEPSRDEAEEKRRTEEKLILGVTTPGAFATSSAPGAGI